MSKLLPQMREHLRMMNYSYRNEETYIGWVVRYISFQSSRNDACRPIINSPARRGAPATRIEIAL